MSLAQDGFLCAACPPGPAAALDLPAFSTFREVCQHSLLVHKVSLETAVQSSTLLPDKLAMYLCRLCTQDHKEVFLCETLMKKHLETHSTFFLKRWTEYTEIQCRICEAVISVTELEQHVEKLHPPDMFADISDIDYVEPNTLPKSPATKDLHLSPKRATYSKPNLSPVAKKMRGWHSSQHPECDESLWSSFQPEQLLSRYFSKVVPVKLEQEDLPVSPPPVKSMKPFTILKAQIQEFKPEDDLRSQRSPSPQQLQNNPRFPCNVSKQSQGDPGKRSPCHPTYNNNLRSMKPIKQSPGKQSRRSPSPVSGEDSFSPSSSRPTKHSLGKDTRSPSQPESSDTQRSPARQSMQFSGKQRLISQSLESCDVWSPTKPAKQSSGKLSRSPTPAVPSDDQRSLSRPTKQLSVSGSLSRSRPVHNADLYSPSKPTEKSPVKHSRTPSKPVSSFPARSVKAQSNTKTHTRCSRLSTFHQERDLPAQRQGYEPYNNNSTTTRCLFCGLQVAKSMMYKHSAEEHQDMMFRCNIGACRQGRQGHYRKSSFIFSNQLNNHHQDYHNFSRNYYLDTRKVVTRLPKHLVRISCSKCPCYMLSPDKSHMLEHLWSAHRLEDESWLRFQCRVCSGLFSSVEQVIEYSRDHLGDSSQAGQVCWGRCRARSRAGRSRSPEHQYRQSGKIRRSSYRRSQSSKTSTSSSSSERMGSSRRKSRRSLSRKGSSSDSSDSRHAPKRRSRSRSSKGSSSIRRSLSRSNSGFPDKRSRRFVKYESRRSPRSNSRKAPDRRSRSGRSLSRRSGRLPGRRSPESLERNSDSVSDPQSKTLQGIL